MYDNIKHGVKWEGLTKPSPITTNTLATDANCYARLSPKTLLGQGSESEEYQVPSRHVRKKSIKSSVYIAFAVISLLLILFAIATTVAVTLASTEWKSRSKLSFQILEMYSEVAKVKDYLRSLNESMKQASFEKCFKDTVNCSISSIVTTPRLLSCETISLPVNKTVSQFTKLVYAL